MAENSAGYAVMFAMMAAPFLLVYIRILMEKDIQEREENIKKEKEYMKLREKLKKRIKDTSDDD